MSTRIKWVDIAKYICIMLVIICHSCFNTNLLGIVLGIPSLMGFLFLSGYCYKNRNSFRLMLKRKIKQLFIPWAIWSFIAIIFHQLFAKYRTSSCLMSFADEFKWNLFQVRGINDGAWFISMMFVSFIPFYFLIRSYDSSKNKLMYSLLALIIYIAGMIYSSYMPPFAYGTNALPWHIEYLPNSMFFMLLGYEYRNNFEKIILKHENGVFSLVTSIFIISGVVEYICIIPAPLSLLFGMIRQINGVAFLILLSRKIKDYKYIMFVGKNTLTYFPMHICKYAS